MCGVAGILSGCDHGARSLQSTIRSMTGRLSHRGPDAEGIWLEDGIALGHRRLAIIDLTEAGAQPMVSHCGRFVIIFNGEIYNHEVLRRQLELDGVAIEWRGHSDTETLLAGAVHWGLDDALKRASGMFALALWDRRERRLWLARDRMGEKPLYWGWAGSSLVFGSELKALRQHPGFDPQVCRAALAQYLRFAYVPAPRSIHPAIYKLEPGCVLEVDGTPPPTPPDTPLRPGGAYANLSIRRFWSLNEVIATGSRSRLTHESEAIPALEHALSAAVHRQMMADVPLGAFLSGGIDSSLIVSLMQAQSSRPISTFTIGFDDKQFDESGYAAAVARHLRTAHTEIRVTEKEAQEVLPLLPDIYDEPFADSSQIPTYLVCRAARSHVTVALSGDGGDELFGGYNRYFWGARIWARLDWMPFAMRSAIGNLISVLPPSAWDKLGKFGVGRFAIARPGDKAHKLAARLKHIRTLDDLYLSLISEWPARDLMAGLVLEPACLLDDPLPSVLDHESESRMMAQDMRTYLPDDILHKVDRAAMAVSLETRVPFLDPDVVALSARLPLHMKIRGNKGKWALRQILYRHVPAQLIERPKAGFGIPVGEWLRGPLRSWAEHLLSSQLIANEGLIDPAPVQKAWREHLSGRRDWTQRLWIILMFYAWRERSLDYK